MDHEELPDGLEEITEDPDEQSEPLEAPAVIINTEREPEREPPEEVDPGVELVTFAFVELLRDIGDALISHPALSGVFVDLDHATPEFTIQTIEDGLGARLSPALKSLYRLSDGFELRWRWEQRGQLELAGQLRVVDFATAFGHWLEELWVEHEQMNQHQRDFVWTLRGFDMPTFPGALQGVLSFEDHDEEPTVWARHPESGQLRALDLELIDYLYCAVEARGACGWQLLFAEYDWAQNPWQMPWPGDWIDGLYALFPDVDVDFFRQHLPPAPPAGPEQE